MRVSFEWLKDFVHVPSGPQEVADKLTMAGLEVEGIEEHEGDSIYEVNVTPNRPDCLSMLGIAREVSAAFGVALKLPETRIQGGAPAADFSVEILDAEYCKRYAGRLITGVSVKESPSWIKDRLEKYGIRSLNNIIDITNYVLIELGHPLHAFDADKLHGRKIRVFRAGDGRKLLTLDDVERNLPDDALLIWDGQNPVAVAGIMGGEESAVTPETVNVFLESAYFEPASIRRTSRKLGLRSESSYRFERGTDIEFLENALNRAALLMAETGGGTIHEIVDAYPDKFVSPKIEVEYDRVNRLLGTDIPHEKMTDLLAGIGLKVEESRDIFYVYPPAYRRDLQEYFDIVEEVARLYNFDRIPVTVPETVLSEGGTNHRENNVRRIREAVLKTGFFEVVNYSFMNPSDLDLLSIPQDDVRRKHIQVRNPLRQEESLMRTTLIPALLNNFQYNLARGMRDVRLFETARVFIDQGGQLPLEQNRLGGIYYRENVPSLWKEDARGFYIVKGSLQALFEDLKICGLSYHPSKEVFLHPGKAADIFINDEILGFMGELGPTVVERLNLKIPKPEILVFELDLEKILASIPAKLTYSEIPRFPSIQRDIALTLDDGITAEEVTKDLLAYKAKYMEKIEVFDFYKGKNIPADKKSLAFRIIYRAPERTLTDSEVEPVHVALVEYITTKTGGRLRA